MELEVCIVDLFSFIGSTICDSFSETKTLLHAATGCGRKCTSLERDAMCFNAAMKRVYGIFAANMVSKCAEQGSILYELGDATWRVCDRELNILDNGYGRDSEEIDSEEPVSEGNTRDIRAREESFHADNENEVLEAEADDYNLG